MAIDENINRLLSETLRACLVADGEITSILELAMPGVGYSGANIRRFDVQYAFGKGAAENISLVVKDASRVERRALLHLYHQGHRCIPFCHTIDLDQESRAPVCMKYIAPAPGKLKPENCKHAAEAVAAIHARNLLDRSLMEWLPPSDAAFIESGYVLGTFRSSWTMALTDADFELEYGQVSSVLEAAAQRFLDFAGEIWQKGDMITLIHGDLHDGNVVIGEDGQPYIIDWDHARCGSLYFDLPNLFPGEYARVYYQALAGCGIAIDLQQFFERYREMGRYVGFKYLGFVLSYWQQRNEPGSWVRGALDNLIGMALNGAMIADTIDKDHKDADNF